MMSTDDVDTRAAALSKALSVEVLERIELVLQEVVYAPSVHTVPNARSLLPIIKGALNKALVTQTERR